MTGLFWVLPSLCVPLDSHTRAWLQDEWKLPVPTGADRYTPPSGEDYIAWCEHLLDLPWRSPRWLGRVRNTARAVLQFSDADTEGRLALYNGVEHLSPPPALPVPVGTTGASAWVQTVIDPPRVADALGQPQLQRRLVAPTFDRQGHLLLCDLGATLLTWGVRLA